MVVNLVSVIFKSIKIGKSLKNSTKFIAKALCTFLFSPQKSLKTLQFINKVKAQNVIYHNYHITTRCTYLAWNSRFSWDIFGSLKILLLRQFRVDEFSTNTKKKFTSWHCRGVNLVDFSVSCIEQNSKRALS